MAVRFIRARLDSILVVLVGLLLTSIFRYLHHRLDSNPSNPTFLNNGGKRGSLLLIVYFVSNDLVVLLDL